jgi:hypothetical protein
MYENSSSNYGVTGHSQIELNEIVWNCTRQIAKFIATIGWFELAAVMCRMHGGRELMSAARMGHRYTTPATTAFTWNATSCSTKTRPPGWEL